jgi:transposase
MAVHDPGHVERWRTIVANWRSSGLSVTAFCRSQALNKSGFHRWRNILDQIDRSSTSDPPAPDPTTSATTFVPLRVIPDTVVEVILPSGLQLRVPLSADARQLARLVLALGAPPC